MQVTPPTPHMSPKTRTAIYSVWGWAALIVAVFVAAWQAVPSLGDLPGWAIAATVAINFFGAAVGFVANDNVPKPEPSPYNEGGHGD